LNARRKRKRLRRSSRFVVTHLFGENEVLTRQQDERRRREFERKEEAKQLRERHEVRCDNLLL